MTSPSSHTPRGSTPPFEPSADELVLHVSGRKTAEDRLPGDPSRAALIDRFLRVDQAGEHGAVRIYQGQLAVLGRRSANVGVLRHMLAQEEVHLATFDKLVADRRARPTLLGPLWHVAGFALGAGTALLGEKAAMACTTAIEEAIDGHYKDQYDRLGDDELPLKATIDTFRREELEHRDIGYANGARQAPAFPLLNGAIKASAKLAIWVSERV
ncbi:demethoxyubiquinone hydroxylase family protein [Rhodospirillum rubrum]|uniref:demethoxyubiquinone hydroxylase family protein n=1 Tax=Rhodospirillum rubrum TaxID=1085 RepID=UPI0019035DEF|nr:demethoxyubiquinone hydroxylase family protein [Rhodospirillum rubrum]MBK1663088.1 demethoxyubiquinone hydroxylase family protein [Rhodospirillum rubrum]MBK1675757.1 demethoxyubiquinone hydroxylase family protein [Rhodospirillum rubrum]